MKILKITAGVFAALFVLGLFVEPKPEPEPEPEPPTLAEQLAERADLAYGPTGYRFKAPSPRGAHQACMAFVKRAGFDDASTVLRKIVKLDEQRYRSTANFKVGGIGPLHFFECEVLYVAEDYWRIVELTIDEPARALP